MLSSKKASIHWQRDPIDHGRLVAQQEEDAARHILHLSEPAQGNLVQHWSSLGRV